MYIVQALVSLNIGGSELVATELCEYLVNKGNKVTILAADGPLGSRARASGASHLDWPIGKKRLATLRYIKRLSEWLAREKPDILHVHSRLPAWICWCAINRLAADQRPVFVTTMHGHYSVSRYSSVMARGRNTIAVSEHIRQYTLDNYISTRSGDVVTIHGGASRELFPFDYRHSAPWRQIVEQEFPELGNKRWLLLPGRITRWKGHVDFMHLVKALTEDFPEVHGIFVGGGKAGSRYQLELEALADKTGIGDKITFTGNRLDIRDWMSAAEIVFNLSNDPPEAFGRTVLESLCIGTPVIAWNHGGASEILDSMFRPGAVTPLDYRQLEKRTREFLAARPFVEESNAFSLETSMNKHLSVYQDLMRGKNR